jgi:hypothetical protein
MQLDDADDTMTIEDLEDELAEVKLDIEWANTADQSETIVSFV